MKKRLFGVLFILIIFLSFLVYAGVFQDISLGDFNSGTYFRTFYNATASAVQLNISQNFLDGGYTSKIFNAGSNATWTNFSWMQEVCYRCELPSNQQRDAGDFLRFANMSGNVLLTHFNSGLTNMSDSSGNDNNGTCSGSSCPTINNAGKFGAAADFETSGGGSDDYINFSNSQELSNYGNQLTLEAWVRIESFPGTAPTIIDKDWQRQYSIYFNSGTQRLRAALVNSTAQKVLIGNMTYSANTWYHVAFTYNGSEMRLYGDGTLDGATSETGNINFSSKDLLVGSGWQDNDPLNFPFDGRIDEVAVYNRSLSAQEIRDHYLRGVLDLNLSARTCDDASCVGDSFTSINGSSPRNLSLGSNQYFQYVFNFTTENTTADPYLYNSSVSYNFTDNTPPSFSSFIESPVNGTAYSSGATYRFNATILGIDGGVAGIEFAGVNYTVTNVSDLFSFSRSNLGAGVYSYYWWANDTVGNYNTSGMKHYTVSVANSSLTLMLNDTHGDISFVFGGQVNASAFSSTNYVELYRDGINVTSENYQYVSLGVGYYNYTALAYANQNYSGAIISRFVNITSPPGGINATPVIHWNNTIVNNSIKVPVFGDSFFVQANISDPENDTLSVNFTITAPNGTNVVNNALGTYYSIDNYRIWNSTAYPVNDYGYWNWSYSVFDGVNTLSQNGNFRVLSDLAIFPVEYIVSSDPKNQTLIWNLSMYHSSMENYNFIFNYTLNSTFFDVSFANNSAALSTGFFNSSNLFKNQVVITVDSSVTDGIIYQGNITAQRTLDGKNYTVPLRIGINPPSGDPDAFNNNTLEICTKAGNCDVDIEMENDETKIFTWIVNNSGNFSLTGCTPSVTGFDISNFGDFSSSNFNLGIGESTLLSLTITQPSINSYYGKLEVECQATALGFNNSLGAETGNVPSLRLVVTADTGGGAPGPPGPPGPSGGSGGGGSSGGGIVLQKADLNLPPLETLSLGRGNGKIISFEARNTGTKFLNGCRVESIGEISSWVSNKQSQSIAPGQKVEYFIDVNVPFDAKPGRYFMDIRVFCDEISKTIPLSIDVVVGDFDLNILSSVRKGVNLIVTYAIEDFSGRDQSYEVKYSFIKGKQSLRDGSQKISGKANQREVYNLEFELPKDSIGQFKIVLDATNGETSNKAESTVVLTSRGIVGFAISDQNARALAWFGVVVLILATLYFVARFLRRHYKNTDMQEGRQLLNVDLAV